MAWRILPETRELTPRLRTVSLGRSYWLLLRSPAFLGFSVGGGCATTSMYAFVASAPFIFVQQLHLPEFEVGPYLAVLILGVGLGSIMATRLIAKIAMRRLMVGANMVSILAAVVLLGVVLLGHLTVALAVGSMFVFTVGVGIASPTALTQAISVNPHAIGSASGLYGFTQMAVGALCTTLAGIGGNPALAAAIVLVAAGVVGQLAFWIALRSRGSGEAA
jgi:DHA1 family bicyclomycin/chloramphenicol resistance-like MFS transporter